jgi:hypothetical protein
MAKALILSNGMAKEIGAAEKLDSNNIDIYTGTNAPGLVPAKGAAGSSTFLKSDGTWSEVSGSAIGDVLGPVSAVNGDVVLFDGITGKLLKAGGALGTAAFKDTGTGAADVSVGNHDHNTVYQPLATVLTNTTASFTTALNSLLTNAAAYTLLANNTGSAGNITAVTYTPAGFTLLTAADVAAQRTALGLGNSATLNTGTGASTVALGDHLHTGTYAPLVSGKVPTANLPDTMVGAVNYVGTWNASTNSPTLANGTGDKGTYYKVSVAGTANVNGIIDWKVGDWIIYNGATWDKIDNTDSVVSVNSQSPDAAGNIVLSASNINTGILPISQVPTGTTSTTVAFGDHLHTGTYAPLSGGKVPVANLPTGTTATDGAVGNHIQTVANGGTNATDAATAKANLSIPEQSFALIAGENINIGQMVYILATDSKVYKATNAAAAVGLKQAIGFATQTVTANGTNTVTCYIAGINSNLSGLTTGSRYYLGVNGAVTATPPTAVNETLQFVGIAISATSLVFVNQDGILL